ncbi:hypothetical protein ACFLV5_01590 [Chloroflexota bacterium]
MKTKLLFMCLFLVSAFVLSGCAWLASNAGDNLTVADNETSAVEPVTPPTLAVTPRQPTKEGWAKPRDLTQQEWERAIQIALIVRELGQWLHKPYHSELVWFAKTGVGWTIISDPKPDNHDVLGYYPGVTIIFNPPPKVVFDIAVDLDAGRPVRFRQSTAEEHLFPKPLTDEEKAAAIRIATVALKAAGGGQPSDYNPATFVWMAQTSNGALTRLDYDIVEKGLPANAPLNADYYPGVVYQKDITPYEKHLTTIVVDLQNGNTVDIVLTTLEEPAPAPKLGPRNP